MSSLLQLLRIEHNSEHDLATKREYSKEIGIYDAKGDLSKRWYIYFSFRNPANGKMTRQPNIYLNFNDFDTLRERRKAIRIGVESLEKILKNGWNPYRDYVAAETKEKEAKVIKLKKTVTEAIDAAILVAERTYAESAYPDYKSRVTQFKNYLIDEGFENSPMEDIDELAIIDFLNEVLQRSSARNRNNSRIAISSLYTYLKAQRIVKVNLVKDIEVLKATTEKNKTFSTEQEEKIIQLMSEVDPLLEMFVAFVSINILRPIEVCRLTVRDINLKDRILRFKAKNQPVKTKIIPLMLLNRLPDFSKCDSDDFLFTALGTGKSDTTLVNRRNYFSQRFNLIKKELGLGKEYGLYSFRHTYITKLYRELRKEYTPFEAKSHLMLITGHTSMKALESYLRDIDAELPEDYSHMLKKKKPAN